MYCLTVSLSQDGLTALSPPCQPMRKVLDSIGVVTGKTAEKQDKCSLGLSTELSLTFISNKIRWVLSTTGIQGEWLLHCYDSCNF